MKYTTIQYQYQSTDCHQKEEEDRVTYISEAWVNDEVYKSVRDSRYGSE